MGSSHYGFHTLASLMDRTHLCEEGVHGIDWTVGVGGWEDMLSGRKTGVRALASGV